MQQSQRREKLELPLKTISSQNPTKKCLDAENTRPNLSNSTEDSSVSAPLDSLEEIETAIAMANHEITSDEKFNESLILANDQAVQLINKGKNQEALAILEKIESLLEAAASAGTGLDRNLVIVILYNIAASYQAAWVLEECSKYTDGVIFNLLESIKKDEQNFKSLSQKQPSLSQMQHYQSIRLKKQQFLIKVYLQHCAVLSQLSRHETALKLIDSCMKLLKSMLESISETCQLLKKSMNSKFGESTKKVGLGMKMNQANDHSDDFIESGKHSAPNSLLKEEVHYVQSVLEFAVPFLQEFLSVAGTVGNSENTEAFQEIKKYLLTWKNNPENNEKFLRKELQKNATVIEVSQARTLLGVQQMNDWLQNFNIGSVMHMTPLRYCDYISKRDFVAEVTKEALQEKVVSLSLVLFTTATEMRFVEVAAKPNEIADTKKWKQTNVESPKKSEHFHLQSIGIVCKYLTGPCPYITHLISSFLKHYCQGLETIPEESFLSMPSEAMSFYKEGLDTDERKILAELSRDEKSKPSLPVQSVAIKSDSEFSRRASKPLIEANPSPRPVLQAKQAKYQPESTSETIQGRRFSKNENVNPRLPTQEDRRDDKVQSPNVFKSQEQTITKGTPVQKKDFNTMDHGLRPRKLDRDAKENQKIVQTKTDKKPETSKEADSGKHSGFYLKKDFQAANADLKSSIAQAKSLNKTMGLNHSHQSLKDLSAPCLVHEKSSSQLKNHQEVQQSARERSKAEKFNAETKGTGNPSGHKATKDSNFQINKNFYQFLQNLYQPKEEGHSNRSLSSKESKTRPSSSQRTDKKPTKTSQANRSTLTLSKTQKQEPHSENIRQSIIPYHKSQPALFESLEHLESKLQSQSQLQQQANLSKKDSKSSSTTHLLSENIFQSSSPSLSHSSKHSKSTKYLNSSNPKDLLHIDIARVRAITENQKPTSHNSRGQLSQLKKIFDY